MTDSLRPELALSYRRASVWDVPLIFDLMSEGSVNGVFSDAFIQRSGNWQLFKYIFLGVLAEGICSLFTARPDRWEIISNHRSEELGFLKLSSEARQGAHWDLELLAIRAQDRGRGIGTEVLRKLTTELPTGAQLVVHCSKYARAMQHILKRHQFKRNTRFGVPRIEQYVFVEGLPTPP